MLKISPFEKHVEQYEEWFEKNRWVYEAELRAVKDMIPSTGRGVEIGVGTGRFAGPLGIKIGVEPSKRMREIAQNRGIQVLDGMAEKLPFDDSQFDFVLMVTTVCFVDDISKALMEAHRALFHGGFLIIGFVDRSSMVGQTYLSHQSENVFYKDATFFSVGELVDIMDQTGFVDLTFNQTIFKTLSETTKDEPVKTGYGEGSFVVIRGRKRSWNDWSIKVNGLNNEKRFLSKRAREDLATEKIFRLDSQRDKKIGNRQTILPDLTNQALTTFQVGRTPFLL